MDSTRRRFLRPNDQEVAAKVIDGEAILINLLDGTYYSLDKVGAFVWERIARGDATDAIVGAVTTRYAAPPDAIQADLERLMAELLEQRLVVASDETDADAPLPASSESTTPASERLPYESPVLQIYRDMEELLALDPPVPDQERVWSDAEEECAE